MIKNDPRAPKLGQHPNIPTHPNTDSRELTDILKSTRKEARLGRRAGEEALTFEQAKQAILAYTANKQLEARIDELQLLHKFAQTNNSVATTALAWERLQQLKNKKESLS